MTLAPPDKSGAPGDAPGPDPTAAEQLVRPVVRRRESQRRRRRTRRVVIAQSVATVVFVALLAGLVWVGWSSTMRITGGRLETVTDPAAPGYVAAVRPTPVTLIAFTLPAEDPASGFDVDSAEASPEEQTGDDEPSVDETDRNEARSGSGEGGPDDDTVLSTMLMVIEGSDSTSVVPISADVLLWDFEDAPAETAKAIFDSGGSEALRLRLGADATFGSTSMLTVPVELVDELAAPLGGVTVTLPDDVLALTPDSNVAVWYPAGPLELSPGEVGRFLDFRGHSEQESNRMLRTELLWKSLLGAEGGVPTGASLSGSDSDEDVAQFVELLETISSKPVEFDLLPLEPLPLGGESQIVLFRIDPGAMPAWVSNHVSFPVAAYPGQRARVRLLNGTADPGAPAAIAPTIVSEGGEIVQTGNAEAFDLSSSRVEYGSPDAANAAGRIAAGLGVQPELVEDVPADVDVVVVVATDLTA